MCVHAYQVLREDWRMLGQIGEARARILPINAELERRSEARAPWLA